MFILAIILLTLGLVCILYYLISVSVSPVGVDSPVNSGSAGTNSVRIPTPPASPAQGGEVNTGPTVAPLSGRAPAQPDTHADELPPRENWKRMDTRSLQNTLKVYGEKETLRPDEERSLVVQGVLYLNHNRSLPLLHGTQGAQVGGETLEAYADVKRVGPGSLVLEGSGFYIRCGNASYSYSTTDLEQILFQERGIALIPDSPNRPAPLFITENPEVIKDYIKRHARIVA